VVVRAILGIVASQMEVFLPSFYFEFPILVLLRILEEKVSGGIHLNPFMSRRLKLMEKMSIGLVVMNPFEQPCRNPIFGFLGGP